MKLVKIIPIVFKADIKENTDYTEESLIFYIMFVNAFIYHIIPHG